MYGLMGGVKHERQGGRTMKFIPTTKEKFIEAMKRDGFTFSEEQFEEIYVKMCRDAALGIIAANALGGRWIGKALTEHDADKLKGIKGITKEAAAALFAKEMDVPEKSVNKTKALEFYLNKFYNE